MAGKLIVFEGGEGCGKTTQLRRSQQLLTQWLPDLSAQSDVRALVATREPGGTELGQGLRQLLLQPTSAPHDRAELLMYAADRAQHVAGYLRPQLAAGAIVLCDRYTDSTIAYQGYGRGLDLALIDQLNHIATAGLQSDLTLWLDLDAAVGLARTQQRGQRDRIEQAALTFHQRVHAGFAALAQAHPDRIVRIDASLAEAQVAAQIQAVLRRYLTQWFGPLNLKS